MKMVYITYRTPRGAVLTDAMTSVENFRRFRGDEDEILDVSPPVRGGLVGAGLGDGPPTPHPRGVHRQSSVTKNPSRIPREGFSRVRLDCTHTCGIL